MNVNYKELLYKKMQREYFDFLNDLKNIPVEKVIEHAYEKVIKEDLLTCIEGATMEQSEAKALYLKQYPLDFIYQGWLGNDCSYMDMLRDTIDDASRIAVEEMKKRKEKSYER